MTQSMTTGMTSVNVSLSYFPTNNATEGPKTDRGPSDEDYQLIEDIRFYSIGVIIFVGLICNVTSLGVFAVSRTLRRTTTGHYLLALSVADTLFVIGEILRWLNTYETSHFVVGMTFMDSSEFACKFVYYLRYASKLTSAWITVVITMERFVTVAFPLKVARLSTPLAAKVTIAVTYVVWFALSAFPFWTIGLVEGDDGKYCGVPHKKAYGDWSMAILRVMSLFVPGIIIFVLTGLIICFLGRSAARRRHQMEGQSSSAAAKKNSTVERQLTAMLLAVAVAFLLLRLPYTICYPLYLNRVKWFGNPIDEWLEFRLLVSARITDIFAIANYAINFFLYCLCGRAFRQQLRHCGKEPRPPSHLSLSTKTSRMARPGTTNGQVHTRF